MKATTMLTYPLPTFKLVEATYGLISWSWNCPLCHSANVAGDTTSANYVSIPRTPAVVHCKCGYDAATTSISKVYSENEIRTLFRSLGHNENALIEKLQLNRQ